MAENRKEYNLDAKWDACLDLSLRRFVYSSLTGAFTGLLLFRQYFPFLYLLDLLIFYTSFVLIFSKIVFFFFHVLLKFRFLMIIWVDYWFLVFGYCLIWVLVDGLFWDVCVVCNYCFTDLKFRFFWWLLADLVMVDLD